MAEEEEKKLLIKYYEYIFIDILISKENLLPEKKAKQNVMKATHHTHKKVKKASKKKTRHAK